MKQQAIPKVPVLEFQESGFYGRDVFIRAGVHGELKKGVVFEIRFPEGTRQAVVTRRSRFKVRYVPSRLRTAAGYQTRGLLEQLRRVNDPGYAALTSNKFVTIIESDPV